jgi:hypothetical protein
MRRRYRFSSLAAKARTLPVSEHTEVAAATLKPRRPEPSDGTHTESHLFEGGPPYAVQRWIGLIKQNEPKIVRRAAIAVLIGWLPLVLLAVAQELALPGSTIHAFANDAAVHARSLVAVPLFIVAETVTAPRLSAIAMHLIDARLVAEKDRGRFDAAVASTLRARDSIYAEIGTIVASYVVVVATLSVPIDMLPSWHKSVGFGFGERSLMGWWHTLVSLPLLLVQFFGWLWRLVLWGRFLWLVSRFDLRLVAAHPDRAGGLFFVGSAVPACSVLAVALGVIVAGTIANDVMRGAPSVALYPFIIGGLVVFVLVIFVGPLLLLADKLFAAQRQGMFDYGSFASGVGRQMERKWFGRKESLDEGVLEVPHFSATTDLYQIVSNVYEMNLIPTDLRSVAILVVTTLLPFLPVVFLAVPSEVVFEGLAKFLL